MAEHSPSHKLTKTKGGWVKRIRGRATWIVSDKVAPTGEAADAYYAAHFADLWAEPAKPTPDDPRRATVRDLCRAYLQPRKDLIAVGRMRHKSYDDARGPLRVFADAVGEDTPAGDLGPAHFAKFAAAFAHLGYHGRKKYVNRVRSLFKWAAEPPVRLPKPDYGGHLKLPSNADRRLERKRRREEHGLLMFEPAEIRAQLAGRRIVRKGKDGRDRPLTIEPSPALRAMILLAVNCGFGNTDLASMPASVLDLKGGWVSYARTKTGAERRAWLWPETVKAIRDYLKVRPKPADPKHAGLLFLTAGGNPYVRDAFDDKGEWLREMDRVRERYNTYLKRLGQRRRGRSLYSLRRTFRTLAAETGMELAIAQVMGHGDSAESMAAVYTQRVRDEDVKAVCQHVRKRVLGKS